MDPLQPSLEPEYEGGEWAGENAQLPSSLWSQEGVPQSLCLETPPRHSASCRLAGKLCDCWSPPCPTVLSV